MAHYCSYISQGGCRFNFITGSGRYLPPEGPMCGSSAGRWCCAARCCGGRPSCHRVAEQDVPTNVKCVALISHSNKLGISRRLLEMEHEMRRTPLNDSMRLSYPESRFILWICSQFVALRGAWRRFRVWLGFIVRY